jgi:hypothetical protein
MLIKRVIIDPMAFLFRLKAHKIIWLIAGPLCSISAAGQMPVQQHKQTDYTLACYYFPNYHLDKRNQLYHGKGWTEWEVLKNAKPRFKGHGQPKVPLWGYTDEADPKVMGEKITAAADHGIDVFIFDWYYYNDGLFLERALEDGFMKAANNQRMKFSLMWANHDWTNLFPKIQSRKDTVIYPGSITPATWEKMTDYVIKKYFKHPSYWLVNGAPYFSIYDLGKLIKSFGTEEATAKALAAFRKKTIAAGFKDLNLNAVNVNDAALVEKLGFNSFTSYVWIHHIPLSTFPESDYTTAKNDYFRYAENVVKKFKIPYYPNVSMGWDASPRCDPGIDFKNLGYPCTPVLTGNTPEAYKSALIQSKQFLDDHPAAKGILTLNSWNEWTEGSYLEPDIKHKMKYLEAIKAVFKNKHTH